MTELAQPQRSFGVGPDFKLPKPLTIGADQVVETDGRKVMTKAERDQLGKFELNVQQIVTKMLLAGAGVTITKKDLDTKLEISSTGGGGGDDESIQDMLADFFVAGENIQLEYDDETNQMRLSANDVVAVVDDDQIRAVIRDTFVDGDNTSVVFNDEAQTIRINAGPSGGPSPEEQGFIRTDEARFGLVPADPDNKVLNDLSLIIAEAKATGKWIRMTDHYYIGGTSFGSGSAWENQDVLIFGEGSFISSGPVSIRAKADFSPTITVAASDFARTVIGDSNDRRLVTSIKPGLENLQKFKNGMVWQAVAVPSPAPTKEFPDRAKPTNLSGFYPASQEGTVPNGYTGLTVMGESATILGISYLYTASATALAENQVVVGETSGAMMVIASALPNQIGGTARRLTTGQVFGTFATSEKLRRVTMSAERRELMQTVAGRETIRAASLTGTDLGTIDGASGLVLLTDRLLDPFDRLLCPIVLRKQGGSRHGYEPSTDPTSMFPVGDYFSNFRCEIRDVTFDTMTDGRSFMATGRGPQVYLGNFVDYKVSRVTVLGSYRNAFQIASCYNGLSVGVVIDMLPNNAVPSSTDGFGSTYGYGWEYLGTSAYCVIADSRATNVRHVVTQNNSGNSGFLDAFVDSVKHGSQKYLLMMNVVGTNTVSACFDTHYLAQFTMWVNCFGFVNTGEGRTDSGGAVFSNRSWSTRYLNCHSVGGVYGFTDSTDGLRTGMVGDGWDSQFPTETLHIGCSARGYQQYGFRRSLRSQSAYHSSRYVQCHTEDQMIGGQATTSTHDTSGWFISGNDVSLEYCSSGSQSYAVVRYLPGQWISAAETPKIVNPDGTTTVTPVPSSLKIIGTLYANQTENVVDAGSVIAISGTANRKEMVLELAGDIIVKPRRATGKPTAQAIRAVEGFATVRWGGEIKTLGETPIREVRSTGGTLTHELMRGAAPKTHYGKLRPSVAYEGRVWAQPSGQLSVFDGTKWMAEGAARKITVASDPNVLGAYSADDLALGPVSSWAPYAGDWGSFVQPTVDRQPVVVQDAATGHKVISFNATDQQSLDLQHDDISSGTTMFLVAKVAVVQGKTIIGSITSGTGRGAQVSGSSNNLVMTASGTPSSIPSSRTLTEEWRVFAFVYNAKTSRLYDNSKSGQLGVLDVNTTLNIAQSVRLGRGSGGSSNYTTIQVGHYSQIDSALSDAEIATYMDGFAEEFKITLAGGTTTPEPENPGGPTNPEEPENPENPEPPVEPEKPAYTETEPGIAAWQGVNALFEGDSSGVLAQSEYPDYISGIDYDSTGVWPRLVGTGWSGSPTVENASFPKGINKIGVNRHIGSSVTPDVAIRLLWNRTFRSAVRKWKPSTYGIVSMLCGGNDLGHFNGSARGKRVYQNALSTMVGIFRSSGFTYSTAANERGTWANLSEQYGDRTRVSVTPGSEVDFYLPAQNGTLVLLAPFDASGSKFTTRVNDGPQTEYTTVGMGHETKLAAAAQMNYNHSPVPVHFRDLGAGTHKITVRHTGSAGDPLIVEVLLPWFDNPADMPMLVMVPPGKATDRGYSLYPDPKPNNATVDEFRGLFAEALAPFAGLKNLATVRIADIDEALPYNDTSVRINDGLHPNKEGMRRVARAMLKTLNRLSRLVKS